MNFLNFKVLWEDIFQTYQGFDKDISLALTEQYLPIGLNSKVPKKPFSVALSITDKIDTIVGFFGINEKPTSSKDPLALKKNSAWYNKNIN